MALAKLADTVFKEDKFDKMKTNVGILTTKWVIERPMIFKTSIDQAHGRKGTFFPGLGVKISDACDAHGVSFVSATQQFQYDDLDGVPDAECPAVLLSLNAKSHLSASATRSEPRSGRDCGSGGVVPLGYNAKDRKITVVGGEANTVRHIFNRYLILGSLNLLLADLREAGIRTKV